MKHDAQCEGYEHGNGPVYPCRCDYRALEAKLAQAEQFAAEYGKDFRALEKRLAEAYSDLAALRPLVRAAVLVHEPNPQHEGTWMMLPACVGRNAEHMVRMEDVQSVELEARALDPNLIAWAKGGE